METIKWNIVQSSQVVRSTEKKDPPPRGIKKGIFRVPPEEEKMEYIPPSIKTKELNIWDQPISKLYTDDCGRFPIRSWSGNEYIMIAYYCDSNTTIQAPFANSENKHGMQAFKFIMKRLADCGHQVDVKILDNEVRAEFKRIIVDDWGATYQLVTPNIHLRNISERAIRTFKAHSLSVLAGVHPEFLKFMWDNLLAQTELTLNLLCQATLNPHI